MSVIQINNEEKKYLLGALEYFKEAEEIKIKQLKSWGGNRDFIPSCEERLKIYKTLIKKCQDLDNFSGLNKKENYYFYRAIDYYRGAEKREIENLSTSGGDKAYIHACEKRLRIYDSLINKFSLKSTKI